MNRNEQKIVEEQISNGRKPVEVGLRSYMAQVLNQPYNIRLQQSPYANRPWGEVLSGFTRDLDMRINKSSNSDALAGVVLPLVSRGAELVSGGVVSSQDLSEGDSRGIPRGGSWPVAPGAEYWSGNRNRREQDITRDIVRKVLDIETDASGDHIGRVVTMVLPALIAWSDLRNGFVSPEDIVEGVTRVLSAEKKGKLQVVTFGCEPYEYEHAPDTTTSHKRRSGFGDENSLRSDAVIGSFRGVRKVLEPLTLSGIVPEYNFYTSFGSNGNVIERQVMPDTVGYYKNGKAPEQMLDVLNAWRRVIHTAGQQELKGSGVGFRMREMESEVVIPALDQLYTILQKCGMKLPQDRNEFYQHSEQYFREGIQGVNCLDLLSHHPDPRMLVEFYLNEDDWSRKHSDSYASDSDRRTQAALLSFFEYCQYQRINNLINASDLALGVEIDEELINKIRSRGKELGENQTPLLWGRPPRFTKEGQVGGVGHRQPWFYAAE